MSTDPTAPAEPTTVPTIRDLVRGYLEAVLAYSTAEADFARAQKECQRAKQASSLARRTLVVAAMDQHRDKIFETDDGTCVLYIASVSDGTHLRLASDTEGGCHIEVIDAAPVEGGAS